MDFKDFIKTCYEKVNLHQDFVLNQCDPKTISYILPFCLNFLEKPIIGYIYVNIIFKFLKNRKKFFLAIFMRFFLFLEKIYPTN